MLEKWVPFSTDLILERRKKSHGARWREYGGCFKVATWIFQYDSKTKRQSREWKSYRSPRPVKARKSKSKVKMILIVFFDIQGIVHSEFLPQGQTLNQTVYKEILRCLVRSVRVKRRSLWEAHAWALYHDNAPAHTLQESFIEGFTLCIPTRNIVISIPAWDDLFGCFLNGVTKVLVSRIHIK